MFQPLYVAATGMNAFEEEMVDITHNLANAKTVGFKKGRTEMESLFYLEKTFQKQLEEAMARQGLTPPPSGVEFGTGVRIAATPKDFTQGTVEVTNNPLDLAINGDGFFQLRMPDGTLAYSRAGNFHMDNESNIVDPNGRLLDPMITLPEGTTAITIKPDGTVYVSRYNRTEQEEVERLQLTRFTNPAGLKSLGQNLFASTVASGEPLNGYAGDEGFGTISQYSLEGSNVDVISEMMRMIMVQRVFETITKAVSSYEGILTSIEKMKG